MSICAWVVTYLVMGFCFSVLASVFEEWIGGLSVKERWCAWLLWPLFVALTLCIVAISLLDHKKLWLIDPVGSVASACRKRFSLQSATARKDL